MIELRLFQPIPKTTADLLRGIMEPPRTVLQWRVWETIETTQCGGVGWSEWQDVPEFYEPPPAASSEGEKK